MVMLAAVDFVSSRLLETDNVELKEDLVTCSGCERSLVLVETVDETDLTSTEGVVVLESLETPVALNPCNEEVSS